MRVALLASLLLLGCDSRTPVAPDAPKTDGVEGHGGIAITEPPAPLGGMRNDPTAADEALRRKLLENEYAARQLYLQGYQLKDSDPKAAATLFRRVVALTTEGSEQHEKARSRLAELGEPLAP